MSATPETVMNPNDYTADSAKIDGMTLVGREAELAAEPLEGYDSKTMADGQAAGDVATQQQAAAAADPTPEPAAVAAAATPAPAAAPAPVLPPAPESPKDFEAEAANLQKQYDDGDLTTEEYVKQNRELSNQQAQFIAQKAVHDAKVAEVQAIAGQQWNDVASAWEARNAEFLSNPLRRAAMQQAIAAEDQATGGTLSPADLFARAQKTAFDAFGWKVQDAGAAVQKAIADRVPDLKGVGPNLGSAPAAALSEERGNAAFSHLDNMSIDQLEDELARMNPAQRDAYLADAPGAKSTGRE
jgi:hypothetical protein